MGTSTRSTAGISLLLAAAGVLQVGASVQRWWPACRSRDYETAACLRVQDHHFDFVLPQEGWVPLGHEAVLAGLSLLLIGTAVTLLPLLLRPCDSPPMSGRCAPCSASAAAGRTVHPRVGPAGPGGRRPLDAVRRLRLARLAGGPDAGLDPHGRARTAPGSGVAAAHRAAHCEHPARPGLHDPACWGTRPTTPRRGPRCGVAPASSSPRWPSGPRRTVPATTRLRRSQ